jgi:hypothetical protein
LSLGNADIFPYFLIYSYISVEISKISSIYEGMYTNKAKRSPKFYLHTPAIKMWISHSPSPSYKNAVPVEISKISSIYEGQK